jgi:hypothetical protein
MLGSILSNILLVLGSSFLAGMIDAQCQEHVHLFGTAWPRTGGIVNHESSFRVTAAQTSVFRFVL